MSVYVQMIKVALGCLTLGACSFGYGEGFDPTPAPAHGDAERLSEPLCPYALATPSGITFKYANMAIFDRDLTDGVDAVFAQARAHNPDVNRLLEEYLDVGFSVLRTNIGITPPFVPPTAKPEESAFVLETGWSDWVVSTPPHAHSALAALYPSSYQNDTFRWRLRLSHGTTYFSPATPRQIAIRGNLDVDLGWKIAAPLLPGPGHPDDFAPFVPDVGEASDACKLARSLRRTITVAYRSYIHRRFQIEIIGAEQLQ